MAMSGAELSRARDLAQGRPSDDGTKPKVEDVVRMFSDDEKMAVLIAAGEVVTLGTPAREFLLLPLNLRQLMLFMPKLRTSLAPVMALFKDRKAGDPPIPIGAIIETLAESITDLPDLVCTVLQRGNSELDKDWVLDHLNAITDLETIIPIFIRQNALDKLFYNLGKRVQPSVVSSNGSGDSSNERKADAQTPITALSEPSASAADITDGPTSTS